MSPKELLFELATYSVSSNSDESEIIYSLDSCFVEKLSSNNYVTSGELIFELNSFITDRELFKLNRKLELLDLTANRLDETYLQELVFRPLNASLEVARADVDSAEKELLAARDRFDVGEDTLTGVCRASLLLNGNKSRLRRAEIELKQKKIDIDKQRKNFQSEYDDINQRIFLLKKLKEAYSYTTEFDAKIEYYTFEGAFVEKGDPICRVFVLK